MTIDQSDLSENPNISAEAALGYFSLYDKKETDDQKSASFSSKD